jgi:hypothetical protein
MGASPKLRAMERGDDDRSVRISMNIAPVTSSITQRSRVGVMA